MFLNDHQVGGAVIVPTVLQLDALVSLAVGSALGLRATDVQVLDPVVLGDSRAELTIVERPTPAPTGHRIFELRGPHGRQHLLATLHRPGPSNDVEPDADAPEPAPSALPGSADLVYPPLFHGPAFQVLRAFGRDGDGLAAEVAASSSPAALGPLPGVGGATPVTVLEGLLQACGVWELAASGRMMRPSRIDEVSFTTTPHPPTGVATRVRVAPRPGGTPEQRVFDGRATDADGRTLLAVRGYRPIPMPDNTFDAVAHRLRTRLDGSAQRDAGPTPTRQRKNP